MSPTNYFGTPDDAVSSWTLFQIYADLGTRGDIPAALDVTPRQVQRWFDERHKYRIPLPVRTLGGYDIYSLLEWADWFERFEADHPRHENFRLRRRAINR